MDHQRSRPLSVECTIRRRTVLGLGLLACVLGSGKAILADESERDLSPDAMVMFGKLDRVVKDLDGYLTAIDFNRPAILGTNYFAVSVAGIDALKDLEEGRGVDPETLAGLYAGFAIPDVARHLNLVRDVGTAGDVKLRITAPDGRLRYKGTVVRLYSPDRLRELFERRDSFRVDQTRKRMATFAQYVYKRQQDLARPEQERTVAKLKNFLSDIESCSRSLVILTLPSVLKSQ